MRLIRKLIYRWGFRPKPGSIFFSPSLALLYAHAEAWRRWQESNGRERSV
jgi:hypothetical protein